MGRRIGKGREWLRNDEDCSIGSHGLVEEVRLFEAGINCSRWCLSIGTGGIDNRGKGGLVRRKQEQKICERGWSQGWGSTGNIDGLVDGLRELVC